jgi:Predicted membrane protein (DUF2157)
MFEAAYRQRLEADLARWQSDGVIAANVGDAIRARLGPPPKGINIATVVAMVGGLLVAAAFLTFVAANWSVIARPARFAILLAGISISYILAGWFDRLARNYLTDICVAVGSIIFGAAIALTGQMYHLSGDFSGGVLLWACGAMLATVLTGSRGALAVALAVACYWNGIRVFEENHVPNFPFIAFWLIGAALAVAWNSPPARHLVAVAGGVWWGMTTVSFMRFFEWGPLVIGAAGAALVLGGGLSLASSGPQALRDFGRTLASYGALVFVIVVAFTIVGILRPLHVPVPYWVTGAAIAGLVLAFVAAAVERRVGPAIAGVSIALGLAVAAGFAGPMRGQEPWLGYALSLIAMLCMVISGMLDDVRPRVVAGWIGLAAAIAAITWAVEGSLIARALFLGVAGAVAVGLAILLGRFKPKEAAA